MPPVELPPNAGEVLLPLARAAIAHEFGLEVSAAESAPWLSRTGACFVTLTQGGALRGCIGTIEAHRSLLDDVRSNAVAVAFRERRFPPLTRAELDRTSIEVSVLSAVEPIPCSGERDALARLRPGVDGVLLESGSHRATFLPQVWHTLPAATDFLAHLKRKAGLPADFWDERVRLCRYTARSWAEQEAITR